MLLINALRKTGIFNENNNINFNKFIEVCRSKDISNNNNDNYIQLKSDKSTSILKLIETIRQKWSELEKDLSEVVDKYEGKFGPDSYGVVDAMYQVLDGMFQKK
jgi:hypothetical protein